MSHDTAPENIMSYRKREKHMFNTVPAKILGLNHILHPEAIKLFGYNVYHVFIVFLLMCIVLVLILEGYNGLYYWMNHRAEAMMHMVMVEGGLIICYKMSILICIWRQIRDCLTITCYDFTSYCRSRCTRLLDLWRNRIVLITSAYAFGFTFGTMLYSLSPLMFRHGVSTMKSLDGSLSDYRINVLNMYAMFSAETYNKHFNIIYVMEATYLSECIFFTIMFDTLIFTLYLAFSCQLQVINVAFESSGPKRSIKDSVQIVILSQVITSTFSMIAIMLNLATELVDGEIDEGYNIKIMKVVSACPIALIQLFLMCYLFEFLHKQKESIGFALYCGNWTEMYMKCRNLILLTMRMNNAHK